MPTAECSEVASAHRSRGNAETVARNMEARSAGPSRTRSCLCEMHCCRLIDHGCINAVCSHRLVAAAIGVITYETMFRCWWRDHLRDFAAVCRAVRSLDAESADDGS